MYDPLYDLSDYNFCDFNRSYVFSGCDSISKLDGKTIGELRILFNYSHQVRYIYSLPELKRLQLTRLGMRIKANQISEFKIGLRVTNSVMCIYNFTCICGARYIGRTTRQLSKRIKEHHPAALSKGTVKSINSSILQHLVDSCHQVDPNQAFNIMYQIPPNLPKCVRTKLLFITESIAIKIHKPDLCKQKQLINTLNLPWPWRIQVRLYHKCLL